MNFKLIPFFLLPMLSLYSQSVEVITIDWEDYYLVGESGKKDSVQIKSNIRSKGLHLDDGNGFYSYLHLIAEDPDLLRELWPEVLEAKGWLRLGNKWIFKSKLGKDELIEIFLGEGYKLISDTKDDSVKSLDYIYRSINKGTVKLSKTIEKKAEETVKKTTQTIPGLPSTFIWKDTQGREIEAYFVGVADSTVTILWEGKFYPIPLDKLSEESRGLAIGLGNSKSFEGTGDPFELGEAK